MKITNLINQETTSPLRDGSSRQVQDADNLLDQPLESAQLPRCKIFPDMADLKETFEWLSSCQYRGVSGVTKFDSGVPGPTVGITVLTHGNEPAGLAPVWLASKPGGLFSQLTCGSVIVAIINLEAATRYFSEVETKTIEELTAYRSIDMNMNRLPADLATTTRSNKEIDRAKALLPILSEIDAGLDIHSTDVESSPMCIANCRMSTELQAFLPVSVLITQMNSVMKDNPIISFFGSGMAAGAVIETGSHQSCHAFENAITTTVSFLQGIGVAKQHKTMGFNEIPPPHSREIYAVVDSIYWEPGDENMLLVKPFKSFEPISKGQLLAEDPTTGKKVFSPCDGHVLFPFMTGRPNNMNEEGIFITLPVRSQ